MKKITKKIIFRFVLIIIILLALTTIFVTIELTSSATRNEIIILDVAKNSSISNVIDDLNERDLLTPAWFYTIVAKIYSYFSDKHIYAGVYRFNKDLSNIELVISLFDNSNLYIKKVTFPEGITIRRFASITSKQFNIDSVRFVSLCYDTSFIKELKLSSIKSLEGYLLPATFNFYADISAEELIKTLVKGQLRVYRKYEDKAKVLGWDMNQVLTFASIIEAETPVISERPIVSGVYHNRLNIGMLLQADPTIQYIFINETGKNKERLLYSDLKVDSPYNTYLYKGLPPTPINSPSASSIEAAVAPDRNKYLYFVAKGDGSMEHYFAVNYSGHRANISKKQKK